MIMFCFLVIVKEDGKENESLKWQPIVLFSTGVNRIDPLVDFYELLQMWVCFLLLQQLVQFLSFLVIFKKF